MSDIKLSDGSMLSFEKDTKKNRFLMSVTTEVDKKRRKVVLHLNKDTMNWISMEIEELCHE